MHVRFASRPLRAHSCAISRSAELCAQPLLSLGMCMGLATSASSRRGALIARYDKGAQ